MATVKPSVVGDFLMKGCASCSDSSPFIYLYFTSFICDHYVLLVLECYCMVSDASTSPL